MMTIILSFLLMTLVIAGMAVGVIFGNKPIKGSCGGMGALGINIACNICGGNPQFCEEEQEEVESASLGNFHDAETSKDD
jgi:hypothetical protein